MEQWYPWVWLVAALTLAVGEIFTTGFYLLCFALAALATAGFAALGFGLSVQLLTFAVVAALAVMLVRPIAVRITRRDSYLIGIDRVVGRTAVVVETIDPALGRGVVRVGGERWSAESLDGVPIPAGAQVEVASVEGAHLKVRLTPERTVTAAPRTLP